MMRFGRQASCVKVKEQLAPGISNTKVEPRLRSHFLNVYHQIKGQQNVAICNVILDLPTLYGK